MGLGGPAHRKIIQEAGHGFSGPARVDLRPQRGGRTEQRRRELPGKDPGRAHAGQDVLGSVRQRTDIVEAEHPGRALDGVRVPEQRVDGLRSRSPGLDREQGRVHLVEPLR